eukprot:7383317-Prymnesium_polylepis.2
MVAACESAAVPDVVCDPRERRRRMMRDDRRASEMVGSTAAAAAAAAESSGGGGSGGGLTVLLRRRALCVRAVRTLTESIIIIRVRTSASAHLTGRKGLKPP